MKRERYKVLLNLLKEEAKLLNTKISIRYHEKDCDDSNDSVYGFFQPAKNYICILVYGKQKYSYILATLAHEIRHAQHMKLGIYKDYYSFKYYSQKYKNDIKKNPWNVKLPNLLLGVRAENDCHRFAVNWLNSYGEDTSVSYLQYLFESYTIEGLHFFSIFQYIHNERERQPQIP
jgi:hypothetical protein